VSAQDPADIFEKFRDFVLEVAPPGVKVTVEDLGGGGPSLTPIDHPMTRAAARALRSTFGREPVYTREGGSIPASASFESILGLPVVLLGFAQPHENAHAPAPLDRRTPSAGQEEDDREDQADDEQDPRDVGGEPGYSGEPESTRDQRDYQEHQRPIKHLRLPSCRPIRSRHGRSSKIGATSQSCGVAPLGGSQSRF
jgi:hypothetical protein